ncbi:hypothetical protein [Fretibacter rubidus]|uniref:hypothetical protein n=1 Tax=Fretibacter rubidus TaxID=570162 RepID=UPI00352B8678
MSFFNRGKSVKSTTEKPAVPQSRDERPLYQATTTSVSAQTANSDDVKQANDYVEQMTAEMKANADQQNIAAKRMVTLGKTIAKMDASLRQLQRFEAQSIKLESDLKVLQTKFDQKSSWASEQENKLINLERQHAEVRQELEVAKTEISARADREKSDREKLQKQMRELENLNTNIADRDERISTLTMTNQNLADDVSEQSAELSKQNRRVMELQKSLEELAAKVDEKNKHNDQLMVELKNLRLDHNELKTKYFETSGALDNAKYDLKTQKSLFEESLKRRDDESYALKSRIEQLNTQVRIKENMSGHLDEEILSLRTTLDSERTRNERAETRLREKSEEVERNVRALARSKVEFENLNAKFTTALEDLDTLRKINQVQKQKLERYASIGGVSTGQSIMPSESYRAEKKEPAPAVKPASNASDKNVRILKAVKNTGS